MYGRLEDHHVEMIGQEVIVQNPRMPEVRWQARAIAIAMDPSIILEYSDGHRMTLPLAWAKLAPPPVPDYIAELDELHATLLTQINEDFDELERSIGYYRFMTRGRRKVLVSELLADLDALIGPVVI